MEELERAPGRKILIVGNHDGYHILQLKKVFDAIVLCAHVPGTPDLLLTHIPIAKVPPNSVNIHGHVHRKTSVDSQRINVSVEQINYEPVPLSDIKALIKRLNKLPSETEGATTDVFVAWAKDWPTP